MLPRSFLTFSLIAASMAWFLVARPAYAINAACGDIIVEGSRLARDIKTLKPDAVTCEHMADSSGGRPLVYDAEGRIDPAAGTWSGNDFADELRVIVVRYDGMTDLSSLPPLNAMKMSGVRMKVLKTITNQKAGDGPAIAHVVRLDDTRSDVSSACVIGEFTKAGARLSRVLVCRSAAKKASDESIFDKAREIAGADLPYVNP